MYADNEQGLYSKWNEINKQIIIKNIYNMRLSYYLPLASEFVFRSQFDR